MHGDDPAFAIVEPCGRLVHRADVRMQIGLACKYDARACAFVAEVRFRGGWFSGSAGKHAVRLREIRAAKVEEVGTVSFWARTHHLAQEKAHRILEKTVRQVRQAMQPQARGSQTCVQRNLSRAATKTRQATVQLHRLTAEAHLQKAHLETSYVQ